MELDPLPAVIEDVRAGRPIVMIDDQDRENEGDLMVAAEKVTPETIRFMLNEGKGLICISLTEQRLRELQIPLQVSENTSSFGTNFAVSFDLRSVAGKGLSAQARAATIRAAVDPRSKPEDFVLPGFVFPVGARPGGVLKRRGQTEGSVDLSRIAGLLPAGVICEIMDSGGKMLRGPALAEYCRAHGLKITSVEAIVQHRLHHEVSIRRVATLPLSENLALHRGPALDQLLKSHPEAALRVVIYVDDVDDKEHLAIIQGEPGDGALVRIHSECLTGDVFTSSRCDCGEQLDKALAAVIERGEGIVIYLHQEGRGIGLGNKLRAYELQDQGMDTVDANISLGFAPDERDYRVGAQILADLGVRRVRLMTNNPDKLVSLGEFGIDVISREPLPVTVHPQNAPYLATKRKRMGHLLPEE